MTGAAPWLRPRTVYTVAGGWLLLLTLFSFVDETTIPGWLSPILLPFFVVGILFELWTLVFAAAQLRDWIRARRAAVGMTPAERVRRRRRRVLRGWALSAWCGALAVVSLASPWLVPVPTLDTVMEVRGTIADFALYGQGSGRRGDLRVAGRPETFRTDGGYGRLRKGSAIRFYVRAQHGAPVHAPDDSVWTYAVEVDGQSSETVQDALRRATRYSVTSVLIGFLFTGVAVLLFRANLKKWRAIAT